MSRIHCSQCGQAGHNRRNRMCPVNVQMRTTPQVSTPQTLMSFITPLCVRSDDISLFIVHMYNESGIMLIESFEPNIRRQCEEWMVKALQELCNMLQYVTQEHDIQTTPDLNTFMNNYTTMCITFCILINSVFEHDVNERLDASEIFNYLGASISIFNRVARRSYGNSQTRIIPSLQNRRFTFQEINMPPEISARKRTSVYFKEISLVHDLTIAEDTATECDCPLCFEPVTATDSIVTNCKHSFCGTCINGYATAIKHNTKKPNCPMCRTNLTTFTIGNQKVYEETREHIANL